MNIRLRNSLVERTSKLNPSLHYQEICGILRGDFVFDIEICLLVALIKGVASPRISKVVGGTKSFEKHGVHRVNSTVMMLVDVFDYGCKSARGHGIIKHINHVHAKYDIPNQDFLYLLSLGLCDFLDWNKKYSWRSLTAGEATSWLYNWQQIGIFMNISGLPATAVEFRKWADNYERFNCFYSDTNAEVARHIRESVVKRYSFLERPIIRFILPSLIEPHLLASLGWNQPSWARKKLSHAILKFRAWAIRTSPIIIAAHLPPAPKLPPQPENLTRARRFH